MNKPLAFLMLVLAAILSGCSPPPSSALSQRVYIWQRRWTPEVAAAVKQAAPHVSGFVVLAAQLDREKSGFRSNFSDIDWETLRGTRVPISLCIRVSPYPGPFRRDDAAFRDIAAGVRASIDRAERSGVFIAEVQLDFDCGEKSLAGYVHWLEAFREVIAPYRAVFTVLPYWLEHHREFAALCAAADGFVLQVHSFDFGSGVEDRRLCDIDKSKVWLAKAAGFGKAFDLALPTYLSWVGFDRDGKVIGVVSEATSSQWPEGTRVAAAYSDAAELAEFVGWLTDHRPRQLEGLLWFRLPVSTDRNNWDLATLWRVMRGEAIKPQFELVATGQNPVDLSLINAGNCDGFVGNIALRSEVRAADVAFAEPLRGWKFGDEKGFVSANRTGQRGLFLRAGQSNAIGWLRLKTRDP